MLQCLIYCRVSTEEQADHGYSLDAQEKFCRDFAERSGYSVVGVFRDEGKSGTKLDRPALQDLLARCGKGQGIDAVIVQETDRLARNTQDHLTIRALLKKAEVRLISVAQPMLDDSPEGKMVDTILASVNQFQSDINSRKTQKGMQEKFEQGWWPSWAPLGYMNVADGDAENGRRAKKTVKNDPAKWPLLQEGFRLYLTGNYSAEALGNLLYEKGLRSRSGKKVSRSILIAILKNPFYAGAMVWKGQRKIGRHEPMISWEEHERVLQIVAAHNLYADRSRSHEFLLRGMVFCGICNQRYTAETHPKKNKSYYHCSIRLGHTNKKQNVEATELERQVEECFRTIQFSPSFVERIVRQLHGVRSQRQSALLAQKQVLLNQQKAIEAKRDRAEEKLLSGTLTDAAFIRLRNRFQEELGQIQARLVALNSEREFNTDVIREVLRLCQNVYKVYKKAPATLQRQYLGLFWDRFVVQDREIIRAVPSELFQAILPTKAISLHAKVIKVENWCPSPTLDITSLRKEYLAELQAKLDAIRNFRAEDATPPSCAA